MATEGEHGAAEADALSLMGLPSSFAGDLRGGHRKSHKRRARDDAHEAPQLPQRVAGAGGYLRGIYCLWDEPPFDRIPPFKSREEVAAFAAAHCGVGTNPDYPNLTNLFSLLVDWEQIATYLVSETNRIDESVRASSQEVAARAASLPVYPVHDGVMDALRRRLSLPIHARLSRASTHHTLTYLFGHMRCGVYVRVCSNRLAMFVPFANLHYRNNWGHAISYDSRYGDRESYYAAKRKFARASRALPDEHTWWANGCIIDNELSENVWGDHLLAQVKDMLQEVCASREVGDCEFFLNKRDHPQLKADLTEPYDFLFDGAAPPLSRERHDSYAPVCSFFASDAFADVLFPSADDWEIATGQVFPRAGSDNYSEKKNRSQWDMPWSRRVQTAFFRGTATGGGCTVDTNQRLHLAHISHRWSSDAALNGSDDTPKYLDAALTSWNLRDKKIAGCPMTFVRPDEHAFTVGPENFVPTYGANHKYLVYVDGHCAAARYAFLMRSGSVILKTASLPSQRAGHLWFFPMLQPFVDHVPVRHDFADLRERIEWCRANDDECAKIPAGFQIAANARRLYDEHLSRDGILNYVANVLNEVSRATDHSAWEPLSSEGWEISSKRQHEWASCSCGRNGPSEVDASHGGKRRRTSAICSLSVGDSPAN